MLHRRTLSSTKLVKNGQGAKGVIYRHTNVHRNVHMSAVKEIFMPALSSTMTEGKVVSWLKKKGDVVKKGDGIVVIESDKADMDVESFEEGILAGIVTQPGEKAPVGAALAYIAETPADLPLVEEKINKNQTSSIQKVAISPESVAQSEPKADGAESDLKSAKQTMSAGTADEDREEEAEDEDDEDGPTPLAAIATDKIPKKEANPLCDNPKSESDSTVSCGRIVSTPYARRLSKELKVPLEKVRGSGPNGRITGEDVQLFAKSHFTSSCPSSPSSPSSSPSSSSSTAAVVAVSTSSSPSITSSSSPPSSSSPSSSPSADDDANGQVLKPFTTLQTAVARNMLECIKVPVFNVAMDIETDRFDAFVLKKLRSTHPDVTITVALAKAVAIALKSHPIMFSSCAPDLSGAYYHRDVNIALAVAMPGGGLITPVLRNVDSVDIFQLGRQWADLVRRARNKQLKPEEYSTGNFAISNLGMYGVDSFTAILPKGMAAILAIGSSKPKLVVLPNKDSKVDGVELATSIGVRRVMRVCLTADHRVVYGSDAAEFLRTLKSIIEKPEQIVLQL